jgi:hypothetical protein
MSTSIGGEKQARNGLIAGIVIAVVCLGVLLYNFRWIKNVVQGPVPITLAELRKVQGPNELPNQWVSFTFDNAIDSGVGLVEQRGGQETAKSRYLLVQVEDRWLITEVPTKFTGKQVVGYAENWWAPLQKNAIEDIKKRNPGNQLLPFQIDAEYAQRGQCDTMIGLLGVFLLIGVAAAVRSWFRLRSFRP